MSETILVGVKGLYLPKHLEGQEDHVVAAAIARAVGFTDGAFSIEEAKPSVPELDTIREIAVRNLLSIDPDLRVRRVYERPDGQSWFSPTDTYRVVFNTNVKWQPSLFTTMVKDLQNTYPGRSLAGRLSSGIKWITEQINSVTKTNRVEI